MINSTDFTDWKAVAQKYAMLEALACQRAERNLMMFYVSAACSVVTSVLLLLEVLK